MVLLKHVHYFSWSYPEGFSVPYGVCKDSASAATRNPQVPLRLCSKPLTLCFLENATWHPHIFAGECGFAGTHLSWGHRSGSHNCRLQHSVPAHHGMTVPSLGSPRLSLVLCGTHTQGFSKVAFKVKCFLKEKFQDTLKTCFIIFHRIFSPTILNRFMFFLSFFGTGCLTQLHSRNLSGPTSGTQLPWWKAAVLHFSCRGFWAAQ